MKKTFLFLAFAAMFVLSSCEKDVDEKKTPSTSVPAALQSVWMYGNFSTTEFWSINPQDYLGNALEFALAFKFEADGKYTQYFMAKATDGTGSTYQQSISNGTVEINEATQTIITHPTKAHYKRTRNGQKLEERDLRDDEIHSVTYHYEKRVEPNGTKALYLTLAGTNDTLPFLQK